MCSKEYLIFFLENVNMGIYGVEQFDNIKVDVLEDFHSHGRL